MGSVAAFKKRLRSLDEFRAQHRFGYTMRRRMSLTAPVSVALLLTIAFTVGYLA